MVTDWNFYLIYKKGKKKDTLAGAALAENSHAARVVWHRDHGDTYDIHFFKVKSKRVTWAAIRKAKLLDTVEHLFPPTGRVFGGYTVSCVRDRRTRNTLKLFEKLIKSED